MKGREKMSGQREFARRPKKIYALPSAQKFYNYAIIDRKSAPKPKLLKIITIIQPNR